MFWKREVVCINVITESLKPLDEMRKLPLSVAYVFGFNRLCSNSHNVADFVLFYFIAFWGFIVFLQTEGSVVLCSSFYALDGMSNEVM